MSEVQIIDVIVKEYYGFKHYYVVVDRMPERIYIKEGDKLTAHEGGFYDFLQIIPGTTDAFAGSKFDISLSDGSTYHCAGQVWACGTTTAPEEVVQVGISTIAKLKECYVFTSAYISKAALDVWLTTNKPSRNYYKYDRRHTIEGLDELYSKYPTDRLVSKQRARTLRRRGVTIRIDPKTGRCGWSPNYEKRKAEIIAAIALG